MSLITSGDPIFESTALKAARAIWTKRSSIGLVSIVVESWLIVIAPQVGNHIDVLTGKWTATEFTMGNYIDSYLEYLVKGGILFGHKDLLDMFKGESHSLFLSFLSFPFIFHSLIFFSYLSF